MHIHSAEFIKSSKQLKDCPPNQHPEYAFIGRSNVGKSSLINMLTGFSKLAKTSGTPGKTQLINHFLINNAWYLTDLPGFGFAKVSKKIKADWESMIKNYLQKRENLVTTFMLIDIRHEPQPNDLNFMEWFGAKQLPFCIVFTKADKLGSTKQQLHVEAYLNKVAEQWDPLPPFFITSAEYKIGKEEILAFINNCNLQYQKHQTP